MFFKNRKQNFNSNNDIRFDFLLTCILSHYACRSIVRIDALSKQKTAIFCFCFNFNNDFISCKFCSIVQQFDRQWELIIKLNSFQMLFDSCISHVCTRGIFSSLFFSVQYLTLTGSIMKSVEKHVFGGQPTCDLQFLPISHKFSY